MRTVLLVEPVLPAVGVNAGQEVERAAVDELGDRLDLAIVLHQIPRGVQHRFRCLNLVAVDVAVDVHRGLVGVAPGLGVVEDEREYRSPLTGLTEFDVGEQRRVRGCERPRLGNELRVVTIVVEAQIALRRRAILSVDGRSRQRE